MGGLEFVWRVIILLFLNAVGEGAPRNSGMRSFCFRFCDTWNSLG